MKKPLVSILIVNWNGGEIFKNCLKSLSKITYPNWELVVVDNASTDGSERYVKENELIRSDINLGFAGGNNLALSRAKGDLVLLLNNDTLVTPNFLTKLVSRIEKTGDIGVVQPKIYLMDEDKLLDNCGSYLTRIGFLNHWGFFKKDSSEYSKERLVFSGKGACLLIKREIIDKIGLFDDDFGSYFEESDFCWRVWLTGYKVIYYPDTHIYHKLGFSSKRQSAYDINYNAFKNRICSLIKNLSVLNLLFILPLHLMAIEVLGFYYLIKFKVTEFTTIQKSIWWNIVNIPGTIGKRILVQKLRTKNDNEIFKYILEPIKVSGYLHSLKRLNNDFKQN